MIFIINVILKNCPFEIDTKFDTYLSMTTVVPLYKDLKISSLHSHRFAENNICAVSNEKFSFLLK